MAYTTIDDPSAHFQNMIYTGDGNNDRALTNDGNSNLKPDLVWIKERNSTSAHQLIDSTRGGGLALSSHDTGADESFAFIDTFDTDGFTLETSDGSTNEDGNTFVAWQWKANGGTRTTFSESGDNPAGGRQVNTTAGFSIIDYTGTGANGTLAHGLNSAPTFWVVKPRSNVSDNQWFVCHQGLASDYATDFIHFDTNGAVQDNNLMWNDTAPTSSVITVGSKDGTNKNDGSFICYAWHDVQGFSKFGSYVGNGNADGPFIYTGFAPAWILFKNKSATQNWFILDNKRDDGMNPRNSYIMPNQNSSEDANNSTVDTDFLSNGFKLRATTGALNASGETLIYMAFAEHPFVSSEGVPCTAR